MSAAAGPSRAGLALAGGALLGVAALAVPVVGVAGALHGIPGATGALAGLALVLVLFGAAALVHAWAARFGPQAFAGAAAAGIAGRLVLYVVVLRLLGGVEVLHWPSLAMATVVGVTGTLAVEIRLLSRRPEFFWVRTDRTVQVEGAQR